jgi:hypothetical protein
MEATVSSDLFVAYVPNTVSRPATPHIDSLAVTTSNRKMEGFQIHEEDSGWIREKAKE